MKVIVVVAAIVVALLFQTTLAGMSLDGATMVNFVLVAVVYIALALGAVSGLLAGAAGGLVQDAIAGGVIGIGGISKTIAGFLVGVLGAQFIVSQPASRFIMFVGATLLHELCFQSLHGLIEGHGIRFVWPTLLTQAATNGLLGIVLFQVVEGMPGLIQRRSARRSASLSRRRY